MAMGAIGLGPKGKRLETTCERSWPHVNLVRFFFLPIFLLSASLNLGPQIPKCWFIRGGLFIDTCLRKFGSSCFCQVLRGWSGLHAWPKDPWGIAPQWCVFCLGGKLDSFWDTWAMKKFGCLVFLTNHYNDPYYTRLGRYKNRHMCEYTKNIQQHPWKINMAPEKWFRCPKIFASLCLMVVLCFDVETNEDNVKGKDPGTTSWKSYNWKGKVDKLYTYRLIDAQI